MKKRSFSDFSILSTIVLAITAGCGGHDDEPAVTYRAQGEMVTRSVWVPSHPLLDPSAFVDACNEWSPLNLHCVLATAKSEADVVVKFRDEPCPTTTIDGRKAKVTMRAENHDTIAVFGGCAQDKRKVITDDWGWYIYQRGQAKHEFGHLIGIRGHIEYDCEDAEHAETHWSGARICGPANMNAGNRRARGLPLTPIDFLAADMRKGGYLVPLDPEPLFPDGNAPEGEAAPSEPF